MKDKDKPLVRGRKSYVLAKASKGGMITVWLPEHLHHRFAEVCKARKVSMNAELIKLIKQYVGDDDE